MRHIVRRTVGLIAKFGNVFVKCLLAF